MDQERLAFIALHCLPGIGNHLLIQLISYCGSAQEVLKKPRAKLLKIPGIGPLTVEAISTGNMFRQAEAELKKCEKENTSILLFTDKQYPSRLKLVDDSPALLYFKGTGSLNPP